MADFNPGDTIRLKSGGPIMTVKELSVPMPEYPTIYVFCIWFDKSDKEQTGKYPAETLEAATKGISYAALERAKQPMGR
jgi:uncharacterized protein YodC (DUF2158 family)